MSIKLALLFAVIVGLVACAGAVSKRNSGATQKSASLYPPTGQILDVNGTKVHAHVEGTGINLILIHGAGGNTREFTFSLVEKLKSRFRVIVIDRPGHGHTGRIKTRANSAETLSEQATLIHDTATQLGVETALVMGQSYGGAVALNYALNYPQATQGVIMVAGVSNPWEGPLDRWYRINNNWFGQNIIIPLVSAVATQKRAEDTVTSIFAPDPVPDGYMEYIGVPLALRASQLTANAQHVNGLLKDVKAQYQRYGEISVPVEIIHGNADTTVPLDVHAIPLSQQVRGAKLVTLDGAGHMPHHANEAAVVAAINRAAKRAGLN